jgi:hypothetical protein
MKHLRFLLGFLCGALVAGALAIQDNGVRPVEGWQRVKIYNAWAVAAAADIEYSIRMWPGRVSDVYEARALVRTECMDDLIPSDFIQPAEPILPDHAQRQ